MTDTNQQIDNELESLKKSFNNLKAEKEQLDAAKEKLETENKQLGNDLKSWINTMACLTHVLDETQGCNWKNTPGAWFGDGYIKNVIAISSINSVKTDTPNDVLPSFRKALKESLYQENTEIEGNVDDKTEQFSREESRKLIEKLINSLERFDTLKKYDEPVKKSVKEMAQNIEDKLKKQQQLFPTDNSGATRNPLFGGEISKSLLKF